MYFVRKTFARSHKPPQPCFAPSFGVFTGLECVHGTPIMFLACLDGGGCAGAKKLANCSTVLLHTFLPLAPPINRNGPKKADQKEMWICR